MGYAVPPLVYVIVGAVLTLGAFTLLDRFDPDRRTAPVADVPTIPPEVIAAIVEAKALQVAADDAAAKAMAAKASALKARGDAHRLVDDLLRPAAAAPP